MTESIVPNRLPSVHLEDLAIIALTARPQESQPLLYPKLDPERRATLRSRLKLISRYDWPTNRKDDPNLRRGYTLTHVFRLVVALLLIDGGLPPNQAISVAANNELGFLRAILEAWRSAGACHDTETIAVILVGDIWEQVDEAMWQKAQPQRVRFIERRRLPHCWSQDDEWGWPGQRLLIDITTASHAVVHWLTVRRLMSKDAVDDFMTGIGNCDGRPAFHVVRTQTARR